MTEADMDAFALAKANADALEQFKFDGDQLWNIVAAILVILMQIGFGLLETGAIRSSSATNLLYHNVVDLFIGVLGFYLIGWAITGFGQEGDWEWFGTHGWGAEIPPDLWSFWVFQFSFAATASTIVSGSICERTYTASYAAISFMVTAFIYPAMVHLAWDSDGFLYKVGFLDFAGSGVVHMTGGFIGLVGAYICGPRKGRFVKGVDQELYRPHNYINLCVGTLFLLVGWFGFNAGSTGTMGGNMITAAHCVITTIMGASGGFCMCAGISMLINLYKYKHLHGDYDLGEVCNAALAGIVSITAGTNTLPFPYAFMAGAVGYLVYKGCSTALEKLEIDDPCDAFAVHGGAGVWGVFLLSFAPQ